MRTSEGKPAAAPRPDWPVWREEALDSVDFFTYLDFLLGFFPVLPDEADLRARLASIGVGGRGKGLYGLPSDEAWYAGWLADSAGNRPPDAGTTTPSGSQPGSCRPGFFWSATMYRLPERLLVDNPADRYSIGDRTSGLVHDDDGGLTLYVQRERPADPREAAKWLPAPAGPFTIAIRVYGPDPAVLDGRWTLPALTPRT